MRGAGVGVDADVGILPSHGVSLVSHGHSHAQPA